MRLRGRCTLHNCSLVKAVFGPLPQPIHEEIPPPAPDAYREYVLDLDLVCFRGDRDCKEKWSLQAKLAGHGNVWGTVSGQPWS